MAADLVITGGTVVDGSGGPGRLADVAITGDRITAIGSGLTGHDQLDTSGHIVAPGFIDNHTHLMPKCSGTRRCLRRASMA